MGDKMGQKMFSIIIPCYNVEKYLAECLDSLISQTIDLDMLEIILVDDCSTDNTVSILETYEKKYPELFVLIALENNGRQGRARNIGMQYATGLYISFVDSDDYVRVDMYEMLANIISEYNPDVIQFRYRIFRNDNLPEYEIQSLKCINDSISVYEYGQNRKQYLLNSGILNESCCQKVYRRDMVQLSGLFFEENVAYEEPMFTYPVKYLVDKVVVFEKELYFYRENNQGTTMKYMQKANTILDHMKVQLALRNLIEKWPLAQGYYRETELYFLHSFYVEPFYFMKKRGWTLPVNMWRYMKKEVYKHIPDYSNNPYLGDPSLAEERLLIALLEIDEEDNELMQDNINAVLEKINV